MRPLPESLAALDSDGGRALFRRALLEGTLEGYFKLAQQFHTQADPAYCGLGSLVCALNALGIDPGRRWKGSWRWFSEELLDCCKPLEEVRRSGITLEEAACLARCSGAAVAVHRAGQRERRRSVSGPSPCRDQRERWAGVDRELFTQCRRTDRQRTLFTDRAASMRRPIKRWCSTPLGSNIRRIGCRWSSCSRRCRSVTSKPARRAGGCW